MLCCIVWYYAFTLIKTYFIANFDKQNHHSSCLKFYPDQESQPTLEFHSKFSTTSPVHKSSAEGGRSLIGTRWGPTSPLQTIPGERGRGNSITSRVWFRKRNENPYYLQKKKKKRKVGAVLGQCHCCKGGLKVLQVGSKSLGPGDGQCWFDLCELWSFWKIMVHAVLRH